MFWGPLFVGSEHADNFVMYDTMETKIAVNTRIAQGNVKLSTYSIQESNSSIPIRYQTVKNGQLVPEHWMDSLHFGGVSSLSGYLYNETMCLKRDISYVEREVPIEDPIEEEDPVTADEVIL